jgi:hypothetical protein
MNLEIIFRNDEIKTQLKAETKEFMKLDKEYSNIAELRNCLVVMESVRHF